MLSAGAEVMGALISKQWSATDTAAPTKLLELSLTTAACSAVEVLGWIVAELLRSAASPAALGTVARWVSVLDAASSEDQISSMRESAASSVLLSKILSTVNSVFLGAGATACNGDSSSELLALLGLRVWVIALTLLQDDDADVRETANSICSGAADSFRALGPQAASLAVVPRGFVYNEVCFRFVVQCTSFYYRCLFRASLWSTSATSWRRCWAQWRIAVALRLPCACTTSAWAAWWR